MHWRLGLKLFSTNIAFVDDARLLLEKGLYGFVELYAVPRTSGTTLSIWKNLLPWPFIIHAPHFGHGVNLSERKLLESNRAILSEAQLFADHLRATKIIVHGGFGGTTDEVIFQIARMRDKRFALENIPAVGTEGQQCSSFSPDHIRQAMASGVFGGFVLDVGHAIYAANSVDRDWPVVLREFVELDPVLFHLSDGNLAGEQDVHHRIGAGDFPLHEILRLIPQNSDVTLETPKDFAFGLREAADDAERLLTYYA